jgi:hypothetical protein
MAKPDPARWLAFLAHVRSVNASGQYDLLVFDPLSNLWPVRDENDAAQVQAALMPLHGFGERSAILASHHPRKSDGKEATASRGSGALTAFVDIILELRRFCPENNQDRKRVLTAYGRYDETPDELVVELATEGQYVSHGTRREKVARDLTTDIARLLPCQPPGLTDEEVMKALPDDGRPGKQKLLDSLRVGSERGDWHREGKGRRNSPFTYWIAPPA